MDSQTDTGHACKTIVGGGRGGNHVQLIAAVNAARRLACMRVRRRSPSGVPARRGARAGGCPARRARPGRVRLARADVATGEARRGRARRRAEAPARARPARRPAATGAGGARPTVTEPPRIAHAECAEIAPCSCGIRRPAPGNARDSRREIAGYAKSAACREITCQVFCQVTGFSRPGNRDKHAHRLPAAPPGVMVVQTAGKTPAITRNNRGRETPEKESRHARKKEEHHAG